MKVKEMAKETLKTLTLGEEIANAITHGVAALWVLIMFPIVSIIAWEKGSAVDVVGVTIFSICLFMMFLMSTIYHCMPHDSRQKSVMKILDHIFIYVAIAGTYTPIALSVIGGIPALIILIIQWLAVIFGILFKSLVKKSMPKVSLVIYLVMGWTLIMFMPLFFQNANPPLFWLIFAGGVAYSVGAIIYAKKGFKFHHMVWHLFVMAGAITHYIGICFFMYH